MGTSENWIGDGEVLAQTGGLIGVCTVLLTATFVGVMGLVTGEATGTVGRLPLYVLASAVVFVGAVLAFEHTHAGSLGALVRAVTGAVAGFVLIGLVTEGVVYAYTHSEEVVASHLFVYLVSAAIFASGLGYWSVRNWRGVATLVGGRGR